MSEPSRKPQPPASSGNPAPDGPSPADSAPLPPVRQRDPLYEQHRLLARSLFVSKLIYDRGYWEELERVNQKFCLTLAPGVFRVGLLHADFSQESTHFEMLEIFQDSVLRYAQQLFGDICSELLCEYRLMGYFLYFNYGEAQEPVFKSRCERLLHLLRQYLRSTEKGAHTSLSMSLSGIHSSWKDWEAARREAYSAIDLRLLGDGSAHVLCQQSAPPAAGSQDAGRSLAAAREALREAGQALDFQKFDYGVRRLVSLHIQLNSCQDLPGELYGVLSFFFDCHSAVLGGRIDSADAGKQIRWRMLKENDPRRMANTLLTGIKPYFALAAQLSRQRFSEPVQAAVDYISAHCGEPVTVRSAAALVHLTPGYFSSLFKLETGQTFCAYVTERKMERAKELLASSGLPVHEVSRQTGFTDQRYFSKRFHSFTGLTPTEYRKTYGSIRNCTHRGKPAS